MTKQAPHVVALKAAFLDAFGLKLNARRLVGSKYANCLRLAVPEFAGGEGGDRALLVRIGGWLEANGYYLCHDYGRQGLLSSPAGWTCWDGGAVVLVRFWPNNETTN